MNFISEIPSEFNESEYLEHNPDVAEAVLGGAFPTAWSHFFSNGYREDRRGVAPELVAKVAPLFDYEPSGPAPPEHLRKRVHGDGALPQFEAVGKLVAYAVDAMLGPLSETAEPQQVLDFGCGSGRVLRCLAHQAPQHTYSGTDIDPEAIAWCSKNLAEIAEFRHNLDRPPLSAFAEASFDVVYSISVFTHLPQDMQFEWLQELQRITRPGGRLLLTTHGGRLLANGGSKAQKTFARDGFYYSKGAGTDGLPDFYQTAFHSQDYVREHWARYFEIEDIIEQGVMAHQDLVLCRRRPEAARPQTAADGTDSGDVGLNLRRSRLTGRKAGLADRLSELWSRAGR